MITRRRVLTVLAGAAASSVAGARAAVAPAQWRGIALGASARIILDHPDAAGLLRRSVAEIKRLENIFSLYRADSELSRLNREGLLVDPAFELVELMSRCSVLHQRTGGAFDPTVQALWALYADHHSKGRRPDIEQIKKARSKTGWNLVDYSPQKIAYRRTGMALTFNGVAQGYIADKVADLLRASGVRDVLVNTGEINALGMAPDGSPWQVALQGKSGETLPLSNRAIATSAPLGTTFDAGETVGHIIDPRSGYPGGRWTSVTVIAQSATDADGLSTGFALMGRSEIEAARGDSKVLLSG
ncbi:MAG: FAD:protein FMN transferase [Alphaproteobacteria bacterium]|nr:FAD:protein FMN transferase [Alphaproteobacteria bacterium]